MAQIVAWLVVITGAYAGVGLLFAVAFVIRGAQTIDRRAEGGSWGFRLAILPASAALWPLHLRRWMRGERSPEERNPHRDLARAGDRG